MKQIRPMLVALVAVLSLLAMARPAGAVDNPDYASEPPAASTPPAAASPATQELTNSRVGTAAAGASTSTGGLAFTGTETLVLVVAGAGLVVVGGLVLLVRRRSFA